MGRARRPLALCAFAALALAVAIAWLAPASLLDARLARATGGIVRLAGAQGTIWQGRGAVVAANAQIPVAWSVAFWPLLRGVARMRVRSDTGAETPRATVELHTDAVTLEDADVAVPAAAIAGFMGEMAMSSVDGEVNANTSSLRLASGSNRGEARLLWRNARILGVVGTSALELGEVRVALVANGATLSGPIENQGGNLGLRGEWALKEKDALTLALRVTPRNVGDAEVIRWLSAVAMPDGDAWRIEWRLPLR